VNYPHTITHLALDAFIRTVFPQWDGVLSDQDWYPGNVYTITVKAGNSIGSTTRAKWTELVAHERGILPTLLNYLAATGSIPEGEYQIEVEF